MITCANYVDADNVIIGGPHVYARIIISRSNKIFNYTKPQSSISNLNDASKFSIIPDILEFKCIQLN